MALTEGLPSHRAGLAGNPGPTGLGWIMASVSHEDLLRLNIRLERERNHLDPVLIKHYESCCLRTGSAVSTALSMEVRFTEADKTLSDKPGVGRGNPSKGLLEKDLVRVMNVGALDEWHCCGALHGRSDIELAERLSYRHPAVSLSGSLGGYRGLFWLGRAADLETRLREAEAERNHLRATGQAGSRPAPAEVARDLLGLIHVGKDALLVYLHFPRFFFRLAFVPTFVDGGASEVFCVWADAHECGFTWRLDINRRGVPEVVHPNGEPLDRDVRVRYLGRVPNTKVVQREALIGR